MPNNTFPAFETPEEGELQTEVVYNAYCAAVGGKSVKGDPLPSWQENPLEHVKEAWRTAVNSGEQWRKDHEANKHPTLLKGLAPGGFTVDSPCYPVLGPIIVVYPDNEDTSVDRSCHRYGLSPTVGFTEEHPNQRVFAAEDNWQEVSFCHKDDRFDNNAIQEGLDNLQVLAMLEHRMLELNRRFPSQENEDTIEAIRTAGYHLSKRDRDRVARGVAGQHKL